MLLAGRVFSDGRAAANVWHSPQTVKKKKAFNVLSHMENIGHSVLYLIRDCCCFFCGLPPQCVNFVKYLFCFKKNLSTKTSPTPNMSVNFDQLTKDLFFHEKRLGLLLRQRIAEGIKLIINETAQIRCECKAECERVAKAMDGAVVDKKMRGIWNDIKVVGEFDVELDLPHLVGAPSFRAPDPLEEEEVVSLVRRIVDAARTIPDIANIGVFSRADAEKAVGPVEAALRGVKWEAVEVRTLKDSMMSHATLLEDLSNVMQQLQQLNFSRSKLRSKKERLKLQALEFAEKGEIDRMDGVLAEQLKTNEELLELDMRKVTCMERTYEDNLARHRSNLNKWKVGVSMLEACHDERKRRYDICDRDAAKLRRGIEYKNLEHERIFQQHEQHKNKSAKLLSDYSQKQDDLMHRMYDLQRQMSETEDELTNLAAAREVALKEHLEIMEKEAQERADFEEFTHFTSAHADYLNNTKNDSDMGMRALDTLRKFLLNDVSFEEYDFHEIARKVKEMMRRAVIELQRTFHEHLEDSEQKKHKLGLKLKGIEEMITSNEMELELCKETLNPNAKKHVLRLKELSSMKHTVDEEISALNQSLTSHGDVCKSKVDTVAPGFAGLTEEARAMIEWKVLNAKEERMERKEECLRPVEDGIIQERNRIETQYQHTAMLDETAAAHEKSQKVRQLRQEIAAIRAPGSKPITMNISQNPTKIQVKVDLTAPQLPATKAQPMVPPPPAIPYPNPQELTATEKMLQYREKEPRTISSLSRPLL